QGLAMAVELDRLAGGERREPRHRRGVPGLEGMVGEPGPFGVAGGEDVEDAMVEVDESVPGELVFDGAASQLVGEVVLAVVDEQVAGVDGLGQSLSDAASLQQLVFD